MANSAVAYMLSATCAGLLYTAFALSGPVEASNAAVGLTARNSAPVTAMPAGGGNSDNPAKHMCGQARSAYEDYASLFFKV